MEINDIIKLINAGYTKADIDAMTQPEAAKPAVPEQIEQPEAEAPEAAQPEPVPVNNDQQAGQEQILAALERLTNSIMSANINKTVTDTLQEESTADRLAKIIAPAKPVERK